MAKKVCSDLEIPMFNFCYQLLHINANEFQK